MIKRFYVLFKTKWLHSLIKGKIFSFASFEVVTNLLKDIDHLDVIIDVGANSGQFTKVINHFYPKATIHTFEPLPDLFSKLKNKFQNKAEIKLYNVAIGNEEGKIQFYKNKYGHISSILKIDEKNIHYPKTKNDIEIIDIDIKKLDSYNFLDKSKKENVLLKLDVQGFELEALKGAENTLLHVNYIVFEANLEQLYQNQPNFNKIHSYLSEKGFELKSLLDFNLGKNNKYIEMDLLYKKV